MNTTQFPNVSRILENICSNAKYRLQSSYSSDDWLNKVMIPYLPIEDIESTSLPITTQLIKNIVLENRKLISNVKNSYTCVPKPYDIVGVLRSGGTKQNVIITSNLSLEKNSTIQFLDIPSFLDDETKNVLIKGNLFFYSLSDDEIRYQHHLYPELEDKIRQQREFLKKYEDESKFDSDC